MIKLRFRQFHDIDLVAKSVKSHIIRLLVDVRFKTYDGWTDPYSAVLDTGAHAALIPYRVWNECIVKTTARHTVRGLVPKEECLLPILIGDISCILVDEERQSEELKISACLALTDDIPLIIGFWDILEKFKLYMDYRKKEAYLDEE